MSENRFLKPKAAGVLVRDPVTWQPLRDEGEWKPADQYWLRRIRDGDVIDETPKAAKPAARPKRARRKRAE